MTLPEQYEYRCFIASACRSSLSEQSFLDLCSMLNVQHDDAVSMKTTGYTIPQLNSMRVLNKQAIRAHMEVELREQFTEGA